jgi:hypothetical protein
MQSARLTRLLALLVLVLAIPAASFAGVFVNITVAPPPLPVYAQPVCPGPGYMWVPGYWAWGDEGYYWVPGTWVMAPQPGLLWTPGYWGWERGAYLWHAGYWGPHVGFYGGVNYGFGYVGVGFVGGEWRGGAFFYNTAVVNVNRTVINNVYINKTVIVNKTVVNNVSYNGGTGGTTARPTAFEQRAMAEHHVQPVAEQMQHQNAAARNPQMLARNNGGRPAFAATGRPGDFAHAVPARAAGGRVEPSSLHANARSMPAAARPNSAPAANYRPPSTASSRPASTPTARPAPAPQRTQTASQPQRSSAPPAARAQNQPQHNQAERNQPQHGQAPERSNAKEHEEQYRR